MSHWAGKRNNATPFWTAPLWLAQGKPQQSTLAFSGAGAAGQAIQGHARAWRDQAGGRGAREYRETGRGFWGVGIDVSFSWLVFCCFYYRATA